MTGNGLYMLELSIYGEMREGIFLFYQHSPLVNQDSYGKTQNFNRNIHCKWTMFDSYAQLQQGKKLKIQKLVFSLVFDGVVSPFLGAMIENELCKPCFSGCFCQKRVRLHGMYSSQSFFDLNFPKSEFTLCLPSISSYTLW